jgi:hypothetical protein
MDGWMWILAVYGLSPNGYSLSAIDEESARVPCGTAARGYSYNDGGYTIGCRRGEPAKESTVSSRSFESDSNVTDVSDLHSEKHDLQSISTEEGT